MEEAAEAILEVTLAIEDCLDAEAEAALAVEDCDEIAEDWADSALA